MRINSILFAAVSMAVLAAGCSVVDRDDAGACKDCEADSATGGALTLYPGYTWREIADGVYLHSQDDPLAGPVDGNSVVIVNERSVYVVDTHIDPAAARAVIGRIRDLTSNPVTHVINTHWHDDHTNGNAAYRDAFPDATFVAHRATLAALREGWAEMEAQRSAAYAKVSVDQLLAEAERLAASEPERAIGYRVYAGYVAALKPELPNLDLVYPDTVFDEQLLLARDGRTVIVEWLGRGNTDGDALVWLPDERLLIAGDLVVAPVPFAFDAPMSDWLGTLRRLKAKDAKAIVPGHGAVLEGPAYLDDLMDLLNGTLAEVRRAHASGVAYADLAGAVDLDRYASRFAGADPERRYAWHAWFVGPGVKSAWADLGFAVPDSP